MSQLMSRLRTFLEGLSPRERLLIAAASAVLVVFIVMLGVVNPILSASARAERRFATAEQELELALRLRRELDGVNARLAAVEERIASGPHAEIFTTLESLANRSAVKVDSMEPRTSPASPDYRETKVQVGLKGVTLAQLVTYLHRVETASQLLSIKSLRIRTRNDKPELLDVTFTVSSFEPI